MRGCCHVPKAGGFLNKIGTCLNVRGKDYIMWKCKKSVEKCDEWCKKSLEKRDEWCKKSVEKCDLKKHPRRVLRKYRALVAKNNLYIVALFRMNKVRIVTLFLTKIRCKVTKKNWYIQILRAYSSNLLSLISHFHTSLYLQFLVII